MMQIGSAPLISNSVKFLADTSQMDILDTEDSLDTIASSLRHTRVALSRLSELAHAAANAGDKSPEARLAARYRLDDELAMLLPFIEDRLEVLELSLRAISAHFTERRHAEKVAGRP